MVGSALVRRLRADGYRNLVTRDRAELDLSDQGAVHRFFADEGIEVVLFYEDYPDVARLIYKETGVPVLGVNPFYEDDDHKAERLRGIKADAQGGGL